MGPLFLCSVFLLSCQIQGSSDVTHVFVQKGKDVRLDVRKPVDDDFSWKFNKKFNIVKLSKDKPLQFHPNYSERAELFAQNCSLLLMNVQHKDSGVYTGVVSGLEDETLAEYTVIVKDPVSPVNLTVNPISSDPCNLTVTCRAEDSHITSTFTCDNQTCSQEGRERSGVTIDVYVQQDFIICNHSNQVSWKDDRKEIKVFCGPQSGSETQDIYVVVISPVVVIILLIAAAVLCHLCRKKRKRLVIDNTLYAAAQRDPSVLAAEQNPDNDASGSSITSTYCLVGPHTESMGSIKTKNNTQPESLYAQVEKPGRK